jgi:hypothetical protein
MITQICSLGFVAAFSAVSLMTISNKAGAAPQCGEHDRVAQALLEKFKETPRGLGMMNSTAILEIFKSSQGSWTLVVTNARGISCISAAGEDWQEAPVSVAGLDS